MKITVIASFDKSDVEYELSIGLGDKTFKWLGLSTAQRFASAAPNGALRRRDPVRRGLSNTAVHQPVEIMLSDGQVPHPSAYLNEFLQDGDTVKVSLIDTQVTAVETCLPVSNNWSNLAYKSQSTSDTLNGADEGDREVVEEEHIYTAKQKQGRAGFMRIMLKSQMPDLKRIESNLNAIWPDIAGKMPRMNDEDGTGETVKAILIPKWDVLNDIYTYWCKDGALLFEEYRRILDESKMFSTAELLDKYSAHIFESSFNLTATLREKEGMTKLSLAGFIATFILCAQTLHNDTYADINFSKTPAGALQEILDEKVMPLAEIYEMKSILKNQFISEENLNLLKEWNDSLLAVFNKYAGRKKELPNSIGFKDFTELLYDAGLTEPSEVDTKGNPVSFEVETAAALLASVRSGTIMGRPMRLQAESNDKEAGSAEESKDGAAVIETEPHGIPDDIVPEDEFTFPEMIEAICRHCFNRFRGTKPDEDGVIEYFEYAGDMTIYDCTHKGIVAVIQTLDKDTKK
jgi:hypothetical protein